MRHQPTPGGDTVRAIRLGAFIWILAVQFFIAQFIVQLAWTTPYSLMTNYISDLGNTTCGFYPTDSNMYVCSPWHAWMNASFILLGIIILLGTALVRRAFPSGRTRAVGLVLLALAGSGLIAVGLFPEDAYLPAHRLGAATHFISGNLSMVVLGGALGASRRQARLSVYSIASGTVGLLATVLFVSGYYLGVGIGGMERLAAYVLPVWLIVVGVSLLKRTSAAY
jgi:hypothetical membrane protein